jgi:hypothetical protein
MVRRIAACALVLAGGAVWAKPPGLPLDPRSEGRERDPVARDHYAPVPPAAQSEHAPDRAAQVARAVLAAVRVGR